ncbi:MAG TPA: sigma-70 family RNA polymerase sigma factor [Gemmata sp.]|jgi:RNA polymerase sigma factor (sigma-70 family)|nr:sigma-70 family RNA polymerase sigma factor [Gemmata sp.]
MAAQLLLLARNISPPVAADRELLDRFTSTRDNDAFSELVRRHGPIVYRICRRLVGTAAADDAFQATFLLLATRTTAAKAATSVGGWLVGVAGRVARQIRRAAQRRRQHESTAACQTPVESTDSTPDLLDQFRILDEELARLPDRLRDPLVSCLLQGRTQEQAAAESGHTTRTVRRRLEEAKRLLRDRLLRRGVTPAVATGLVAGLASVSVAIPAGLGMRTVAVVFDFLTGGAAIASPPVVLAKGVATTMLARKVMTLMTVVAVGLTSLGIVLADDPRPNQPPTPAKAPDPRVPIVQALPTLPAPIQLGQLAQNLKAGEPQVVIQGLCMQVTGGFCEESGLTVDNPKTGEMSSWVLTTLNLREVKMLTAMIRGLQAQERVDILSRPMITVLENQTGYFQAGQTFDVAAPPEATKDNGKTVPASKIPKVSYSVGPCVALKVTPKIDKDSGKILLRVDAQTTSIGGHVIVNSVTPAANGQNTLTTSTVPSMNVETVQTTVMLPDGGTAVIGNVIGSAQDRTKKTEMLWVLTAHLVRGKP